MSQEDSSLHILILSLKNFEPQSWIFPAFYPQKQNFKSFTTWEENQRIFLKYAARKSGRKKNEKESKLVRNLN